MRSTNEREEHPCPTAIAQEERALAAVSAERYVARYVLASTGDARIEQKDIIVPGAVLHRTSTTLTVGLEA